MIIVIIIVVAAIVLFISGIIDLLKTIMLDCHVLEFIGAIFARIGEKINDAYYNWYLLRDSGKSGPPSFEDILREMGRKWSDQEDSEPPPPGTRRHISEHLTEQDLDHFSNDTLTKREYIHICNHIYLCRDCYWKVFDIFMQQRTRR